MLEHALSRPDTATLRGIFTSRLGKSDPTVRRIDGGAFYASWTPVGSVALRIVTEPGYFRLGAWGEGAEWMLERSSALLGLEDEDSQTWRSGHPLIDRLAKKHGQPRMGRGTSVFDLLCRTIFEQRVTSVEAMSGFARFTRELGTRAPGPHEGLMLPPDPEAVKRLPYYDLHGYGLERTRAETLIRVSKKAGYLEAGRDEPAVELERRLRRLKGVGSWTSSTVAMRLGNADAVPVGDYHLPNLVSWALAKEPRGTDERMLELLEPFRPHRARVVRLLSLGVGHAPRYGPKARPSRWTHDPRY